MRINFISHSANRSRTVWKCFAVLLLLPAHFAVSVLQAKQIISGLQKNSDFLYLHTFWNAYLPNFLSVSLFFVLFLLPRSFRLVPCYDCVIFVHIANNKKMAEPKKIVLRSCCCCCCWEPARYRDDFAFVVYFFRLFSLSSVKKSLYS